VSDEELASLPLGWLRRSGNDRLGQVERDIRRSQAEALGRVGEKLDTLLGQLGEADRRLDALEAVRRAAPAEDGSAVCHEFAARNRLRDQAARARHDLMVQREALGLAGHALVEQRYPVPGRRRLGAERSSP
jgi:hypothetical protein